ncbi:MAG: hypothetical protein WA979_12530 [Pacificimonas sp.]
MTALTAEKPGLKETISYVAARLTTPLPGLGWHRYRLLAVPRVGMPTMPRGYRVEETAANELEGRIDASADVIAYRRAQGLTALAAFRDDLLVGVNWISASAFNEDEVAARWVPPAKGAWDTGLWVHPGHRLSRAFSALWAGTSDWMRERQLDWSFSRIADYNLGSLAPHLRMGGITVGTASFARFGPLQLADRGRGRVSAGAPVTIKLEIPR